MISEPRRSSRRKFSKRSEFINLARTTIQSHLPCITYCVTHTMCHTVVVVKRNLRTSFTVVRTGWLQCGAYGIAWAARYGSQAAMDHSIVFFFTFNQCCPKKVRAVHRNCLIERE